LSTPVVLAAMATLLCPLALSPASAEMIGGNPGPQYNYICPDADNKPALDCYFDAVTHLYTMCKHVKSIEIIEYGYDQSMEGTNGAKSESCLTKQKLNMTRPYQAALKAATISKEAVEQLRALNELWLKSLSELTWQKGESDEAYKARTQRPYEAFAAQIVSIQTVMQRAEADPKLAEKAAEKPAPGKKAATKAAAKAAPAAAPAKAGS
jgi:hypothetical protein